MAPLSTRRELTAIVTFLALVLSACGGGSTTVISSPRVTAEGDAATQAPLPADAIEAEAPAGERVPEEAAPEIDVPGETDSSAEGEDEFVLEFDFGDVVLDGDEETDEIRQGGLPVGASFLTQVAAATESSASYRYDVNFSMYLADGATVFDISPSELGPDFAALGELAEGWGTVDLASLDDSLGAGDIAGISGAQTGSSPDQLLDMLREVSDVTEVGPESVRGVATTHLRVAVSMASMLDAQGVTAADMGIDLAAFDVRPPSAAA